MTERERFEEWCKSESSELTDFTRDGEDYQMLGVYYAWRAWQAATAPRPAPEGTVQVRIPVVVDGDGDYAAMRFSPDGEDFAMAEVRKKGERIGLNRTVQKSWITANVPLPAAPVEVEGSVESA